MMATCHRKWKRGVRSAPCRRKTRSRSLLSTFQQNLSKFVTSLKIHESTAIRLFSEIISSAVFVAIKVPLIMTSAIEIPHEGTLKSYAGVMIHFFMLYAAYDLIAKADKEVWILRQDLLAPWNFFQILSDLSLRCCGAYSEQTLLGSFWGNLPIICYRVRWWWVKYGEVTISKRGSIEAQTTRSTQRALESRRKRKGNGLKLWDATLRAWKDEKSCSK